MKNLIDLISEKKYHNGDNRSKSEGSWEFDDDMYAVMDALFDDRLTLDFNGEKYKLSLEGKRKDIYIKAEKISE